MFKRKKNLIIEEGIAKRLTGNAQKNALDFVAFMRANDMSIDPNNGGDGWAVGGKEGDSLGYAIVNGASEFPGPWTLWFNVCDFAGDADDALKEAAWTHASPCGKCHKGWENCGGGNRVIFGKEFDRLCHSPLMFVNPDAQALEHIKKLLLMLK